MSARRRAGRGQLDPEASVVALVRHAHRGVVTARATETVFVGLAALVLTLAAALLDGGQLGRRDTWIAAVIMGAFAARAWALGHRGSPVDTARRLDSRLGLAGALVTAFESERPASSTGVPIVSLLAARVVRAVPRSEALRRALPSSGIPIASPFVAAALLALAIEAVAPAPTAPGLEALTGALSDELERARGASLSALEEGRKDDLGAAANRVPASLSELLSSAERLDVGWRGGSLDQGQARASIEELERQLDEVALSVPPGSELARALAAAGTLLDAARMQLRGADGEGPAGGSGPGGSGPGGSGPGGGDPSGADGGSSSSSDERALAPEARDGRIAAPRSGDADEIPSGSALPELGAVSSSWPAEYDEVVARWVELQRVHEER